MKIILLALTLIVVAGLTAQTSQWQFWSSPSMKALMVSTPNHIYCAANPGMLRINIQTQAIERFYSFNSGLPQNDIRSLYYDQAQELLWIGGDGCLTSLDAAGNWQSYDLSGAPSPLGWINAIGRDSGGFLWLGCTYGLFRTDFDSWTVYNNSNTPLSQTNVWRMLIDHLDRIWIGTSTYNGDLACFDGGAWTVVGPGWGEFNFILEDWQNIIWLSADDHLKSYDGVNWTTHTDPGLGIIWYNFLSGGVDNYNNKYFGTWYGDVIKYNGSQWTLYNSLSNSFIYSLVIDAQNNIWYGTSNIHRNLVPVAGVNQITNQHPIIAFRRDRLNRMWTAHFASGLSRFDGADWQCFGESTFYYLYGGINDLAFDSGNTLWAINDNRIINYDGEQWSQFQPPANLLPYRNYKRIEIDPRDKVWIGGEYGLLSFSEGAWEAFTSSNSVLPSNQVKDLSLDADGRLWIAVPGGIVVHDRGFWQVFDPSNAPFNGTDFSDIFTDQFGRVWARTSTHLYCYQSSQWTAHPLPFASTSNYPGLGVDQQGRVWLNTPYQGTGVFDGESWQILNYTNSHLQWLNPYAVASDPDGRIWISGNGGVQTYFEQTVETADDLLIPDSGIAARCFPNPFNPSATITVTLPQPDRLDLRIYDLRGRLVKVLSAETTLGSGTHSFVWYGDGRDGQIQPSGIYFCRIRGTAGNRLLRLVLAK